MVDSLFDIKTDESADNSVFSAGLTKANKANALGPANTPPQFIINSGKG